MIDAVSRYVFVYSLCTLDWNLKFIEKSLFYDEFLCSWWFLVNVIDAVSLCGCIYLKMFALNIITLYKIKILKNTKKEFDDSQTHFSFRLFLDIYIRLHGTPHVTRLLVYRRGRVLWRNPPNKRKEKVEFRPPTSSRLQINAALAHVYIRKSKRARSKVHYTPVQTVAIKSGWRFKEHLYS